MRRMLTILLSIVLLLSMVLMAAGCGPGATTVPSSVADTEVPTEAPAAPTATAAAPEVGPAPEENIARIAFYMEPVDLDPSNNFFGDTGLVSVMYETLTFYNPSRERRAHRAALGHFLGAERGCHGVDFPSAPRGQVP